MTLPKLAVVMAGGRGTRFWPRSRAALPKQFLPITGPETLLVETVRRLEASFGLEHIFVLTTEDLADEARRQLPELPPENVLLEPEGRNTAPCLALCLVALERRFPQGGVMAVLSADHWIGETEAYLADLDLALDVDFFASVFSNSLAVRRLGLHRRLGQESVVVAEVQFPDLTVEPVVHHYRTVELSEHGARLRHQGPNGHHELTVDREGFVIDVPHLSYRLK